MKSPRPASPPPRLIRSFIRRNSRMTPGQQQAYEKLHARWCLTPAAGFIDLASVFGRQAPCFLEIGFGSGQSLAALAAQQSHAHFIGIETFKPGIGALLQQIEAQQLHNIRIYEGDAVEIIDKCIPLESLDGINIFFPDPWPKSRHHKRRLIQPSFVELLLKKLKRAGTLHLATDWQDYARQMMKILTAEKGLKNLAGPTQYAQRSTLRPLLTKFEHRALQAGRSIWELQFTKV